MFGNHNSEAVQRVAHNYQQTTHNALGIDADMLSPEVAPDLGKFATKVAAAIVETRESYERNERAATTLFERFIPSLIKARQATHDIALSQGQFTTFDHESLAQGSTNLSTLQEYLAPFQFRKNTSLPPDVPGIDIQTFPRLLGEGRHGHTDAYISHMNSKFDIVASGTEWPGFSPHFNIPVLIDPTTITLEEFGAMEAEAANGYAQQVTDSWQSFKESERDNPSFTGTPLVVRAVAVLPVSASQAETSDERLSRYEVDFLPQITKSVADKDISKRAYDVRLLVRGDSNMGSNHIRFEHGINRNGVYADKDGKRAPLTVQRGETVTDTPTSLNDATLTPRSQSAIALFLAPKIIKEKPFTHTPIDTGYGRGDYGTFGGEVTRGVGSASINIGPSSSFSSAKREDGLFDRVAPELEGRPIIFSIQLLTVE